MKYLFSKKSILFFVIGLALIYIGILTSCVKQEFDVPPLNIPHVDFPATATIDSLKEYYILKPHLGAVDTLLIKDDLIIQGVINSTDESGNIYKNLFIQDQNAGITLTIDQGGLSASYKLGQRVFIKCKGLYMGTYGGMIEIGYGVYNNQSIGRIPPAMLADHIFLDSLPKKYVAPVVIDPKMASIKNNLCMLVELRKVQFPDTSSSVNNTFVTGAATTNHNVADSLGNAIMNGGKNFIIRTSSFADFATDKLPAGVGTLRGILTSYNGQFQLTIRDRNDYTPW
jgi:hypothetical protein